MSYPILYKSNETDFFAMGLGPIEMLKATVTQERNGIFIFEGEILTDNPLFPLVLENYIIKADADHLLKDQRFRIKRVVPNHNGKAQIYAEHVSYLSRELTIKPEVNITGSAQVALSQWKASIVESNPFVVSSDITTSASAKWRIDKVSNPMMALGGVEGSILDRWGGEYLFDNYHISLLKKRGKTATNILAYGRNITDFEQERNILSTYTSIAPYAIYTDDNEREVIVTVDGYVVDSEHVNKFPNRVTKPIDFSSEFGSDEIPTKARLTTLAQQYIADNEIGVPTTSIKISFLDLSQTADYADYAFLEQVNLCDDVRVHYPKLGVNTIAKVVRVVWNCLTESYDEIEIGQKRMSLASQIQEQNKVIQEINTQVNQSQVSADGKNMIFYGLYGENGLGEPNATKIGDSWFKPNGLETELYVWTGIEWKLIMSTSAFNEINETIKDLDGELEQTTTTANDAVNKAEQAIRDAGFANSSITAANGQIASLEQNLEGFQQVVQNTYADKTTVTALANQWTQTTELANGHTSAINSLGEQLNLRVAKSELISQINISPETILIASNKIQIKGNTYIESGVIKNAHIADLAVSGAKIANATIASAKIINLDASKITTGELNTSLVNIFAANGNKRVQINGDGLSATDVNGKLRLALGVRDLGGTNQSDPSNLVFYSGNANNSMYIGTNVNDTFVIAPAAGRMKSLFNMPEGLSISSRQLRLTDPRDTGQYIEIRRTTEDPYEMIIYPSKPGSGHIGNNYGGLWWSDIWVNNVNARELNIGYGSGSPHKGDLSVGDDGGTPSDGSTTAYVRSQAIYNRIYGSLPSVGVTEFGTLGRIVSARKYKENITNANQIMLNAKRILDIYPSEWHVKGKAGKREYGFIADEFHEVGLTEVVQYGADGQVEGLAYDRISMYHNVILQDHERQLSTVAQQLTTVSKERLQHSLLLESKLLSLENTVLQLQQEIEQLRTA